MRGAKGGFNVELNGEIFTENLSLFTYVLVSSCRTQESKSCSPRAANIF